MLQLAAGDARQFTEDMQKAGEGVYEKVEVNYAIDREATLKGLETKIDQLATSVHPRDTVILFVAAHGISVDGRFYLIPQDYQGGDNPLTLEKRAIGQHTLQDWLANRIRAKKVLVLLDTCRSGALVAGHLRPRDSDVISEAAVGRLHEATGRPILTAAAIGQNAYEGYEGHGIFTYALLKALRNADDNKNGMIELSELVAHVQAEVPILAARMDARGSTVVGEKGAATTLRGASVDTALQTARFGSRGENFVLGRRLPPP